MATTCTAELIRVDGGRADHIPLPPGRSTIGRGTQFKCPDRRVSRQHAVLEVTEDSQLLLTPLHTNPCFYQKSGDDTTVVLHKGTVTSLQNGDQFLLLPGAYCYQVVLPDLPHQGESPPSGAGESRGKKSQKKCQNNKDIKLEESPKQIFKEFEDDILKENLGEADPAPAKERRGRVAVLSSPRRPSSSCQPTVEGEDMQEVAHLPDMATDCQEVAGRMLGVTADLDCQDCAAGKTGGEAAAARNRTLQSEESAKTVMSNRKRKLPVWLQGTSDGEAVKGKQIVGKGAKKHQNAKETNKEAAEELQQEEVRGKQKQSRAKTNSKKNRNVDEKQNLEKNLFIDVPTKSSEGRVKGKKTSELKQKVDDDANEEAGIRTVRKTEPHTEETTPKNKPFLQKLTSSDKEASPRNRGASRMNQMSSSDEEASPANKGGSRTNHLSSSDEEASRENKGASRMNQVSSEEEETSAAAEVAMSVGTSEGQDKLLGSLGSQSEARNPPSPSPERRVKRPPCQYRDNCYRRNPVHKQQYSHPGDSDYSPEPDVQASDSDDDRLECEYGTTCYRKNPEHRRDFKHTRKPRHTRKAKRPAGEGRESPVDDYDYDDLFLNDDSSDDYVPTDSDSDWTVQEEESEDLTRTLKEAKRFMRNSKQQQSTG